jgi:DNA-binding FadR family transcriptional regulator
MGAETPIDQPLKQVRISDQIADQIVRYISEERLSAGDALPSENEWARTLGVSRPAVREATNALAGRGLIHISSGRPPTVLSLSEGPFSVLINHALITGQVTPTQVLEVRRGIEENAAALAAAHHRPDDIATLKRILAELRAAVGNVEAFSKPDVAFHRALAQATGNLLLSSITAGMASVALESSRIGLRYARSTAEWDEILFLHEAVALAVEAGDAERARNAMKAHFDSALGRLEREVQETRGS